MGGPSNNFNNPGFFSLHHNLSVWVFWHFIPVEMWLLWPQIEPAPSWLS